jgi:hypothetical protein
MTRSYVTQFAHNCVPPGTILYCTFVSGPFISDICVAVVVYYDLQLNGQGALQSHTGPLLQYLERDSLRNANRFRYKGMLVPSFLPGKSPYESLRLKSMGELTSMEMEAANETESTRRSPFRQLRRSRMFSAAAVGFVLLLFSTLASWF